MQKIVIGLMFLAAPGLAQAVDCSSASVPQATPLRPTVLAPISAELSTPSYQLGAQGSVLSQAYDESQSVDQVLLRLRIEGCQSIANAMPAPSAINPNDPAAYKPQTAFDNTPWRFDMSQNGKRMTADEFSAWMASRGVRIAKGAAKPPEPAAVPAAMAPGIPPGAAVTAPTAPMAPAAAPAVAPAPAAPTSAVAPAPAVVPVPATPTPAAAPAPPAPTPVVAPETSPVTP